MALRGGDGWETPALVVLVLVVDLLKRDYRGTVRTQRMRHAQPTISLFLFKPSRAPPKKPGTTTGTRGARLIPQDAQKQEETRGRKRREANPTKRKSGSSWPVLVADWAACFLSTSPAVSIFITTAVQEDHQSACMVGWGWDARRLSCCAGGFGISTRRDAMRWFQSWSRDSMTLAWPSVWSLVEFSMTWGTCSALFTMSICRRLLK